MSELRVFFVSFLIIESLVTRLDIHRTISILICSFIERLGVCGQCLCTGGCWPLQGHLIAVKTLVLARILLLGLITPVLKQLAHSRLSILIYSARLLLIHGEGGLG